MTVVTVFYSRWVWSHVRDSDRLRAVQRQETDSAAQDGERGEIADDCAFYGNDDVMVPPQALGDIMQSLHGLTIRIGNPNNS